MQMRVCVCARAVIMSPVHFRALRTDLARNADVYRKPQIFADSPLLWKLKHVEGTGTHRFSHMLIPPLVSSQELEFKGMSQ